MNAVIYIEGGGDKNESLKSLFRRSWARFFAAAGLVALQRDMQACK